MHFPTTNTSTSTTNPSPNSSLTTDKLAVVMVGLPASGKSFIARNLSRYLRWLGVETSTFSAALYRQKMLGTHISADFFDPNNHEFLDQRTQVADATLHEMLAWFNSGLVLGNGSSSDRVAIMDASNTLQERRDLIRTAFESHGIHVIFIECIYETEGLLHEHLHFLNLLSPDYENMTPAQAAADYKRRIHHYRVKYDAVNSEKDSSFIKIINGGKRLVVNNVSGFLPSKIIFYLMNLHFGAKKIYLQVSHADLDLTQLVKECKGLLNAGEDSQTYPNKIQMWIGPESPAQHSECKTEVKSLLAPINLAHLEGLTEGQIAEIYPDEVVRRQVNPYRHRHPRCESYADLSRRLETVMMEMERLQDNVLIAAHISVIRCIYSFYVETSDPNIIPSLKLLDGELIELVPQAYGCFEGRYRHGKLSRERIFRPYLDQPPSSYASPKILKAEEFLS